MNRLILRMMPRPIRKARLRALVEELASAEADLRDICSSILELTEPGDDLHLSVLAVLQALDG